LRQDWPRVPLPAKRDALEASTELGRQVAALLDPETPVPGVTTGKVREELRDIAKLRGSDLRITAGWGIAGKDDIVMPAKGRLNTAALPKASGDGFPWSSAHDVYLNGTTRWESVPDLVWDYTLGGYQVLKKWLSYREAALLERTLTLDEARDFTHVARRIAALILLQPALDASYKTAKSNTAKTD